MSFKPEFTLRAFLFFGVGQPTPGDPILADEPCAYWLSSGRRNQGWGDGGPYIHSQLAIALQPGLQSTGWSGWPAVWRPELAIDCSVRQSGAEVARVLLVNGAPMWAGTPDEHWRWNCTQKPQGAFTPPQAFGVGGPGTFQVTFDVYRPFGAATPIVSGQTGYYTADIADGRGGYSGGNYFNWSEILDVASSVDVRDGSSRAAGLDVISYADGDEVRIQSGASGSRYVVVRVVNAFSPPNRYFKRVYLLRDQAHWPGPISTP